MTTPAALAEPQMLASTIFAGCPDARHLTAGELEELALCERTIATGWQTFVEVGIALSRIRDRRLYRAEHMTFEAYCRSKWQFQRAYAYRLMAAAQIVTVLSPGGNIPSPANEAQVRPLIGLTADQMRQTWEKACAITRNGTPTSRLVAKLAASFRSTSPRDKAIRRRRNGHTDSLAESFTHIQECLETLENDIREGQVNLADLAYISEVRRQLRVVRRGIAGRRRTCL